MLATFFDGVLPVFAVLAIGYAAGRTRVFDAAMATAINRFVILIAVPLLVFRLLARAPFEDFDWRVLSAFLISELVAYAVGFCVARFLFQREAREAVLLGLASCFANHLLFVLSIATLLFGERASIPIVAIASIDALTIYGGTLMLMEAMTKRELSWLKLLMQFAKNPAIAAIPIGLAVAFSGMGLPKGVDAFAAFVSQTASPCALFALGIILSQQPDGAHGGRSLPLTISAIKLVGHPVVAWLLIAWVVPTRPEWGQTALMVAASPSAAMAFVFALQYRVSVEAIAKTVLYTSIGSLATVTFIASVH